MPTVWDLFRLDGRVAIVTGGAGRLGSQMCDALAEAGAHVVVASRDLEKCRKKAGALPEQHAEAMAVALDHADRESAACMVRAVMEKFGRIDVLVNNAGWSKRTPHAQLEDLTDEIWERTLNTNLRGAFYCMRAAAPYLKKQPGASIINIASIAPYSGQGSSIVYAASKAGLISMTKSFARVLAPEVRVNAIAPGFVRTRFAGWPQETFDEAERRSALQRIPTPEEVGAAAVFLAADATAITGETINVDAGQTSIGRTV